MKHLYNTRMLVFSSFRDLQENFKKTTKAGSIETRQLQNLHKPTSNQTSEPQKSISILGDFLSSYWIC